MDIARLKDCQMTNSTIPTVIVHTCNTYIKTCTIEWKEQTERWSVQQLLLASRHNQEHQITETYTQRMNYLSVRNKKWSKRRIDVYLINKMFISGSKTVSAERSLSSVVTPSIKVSYVT